MRLMRKLNREQGKTLIVVTHNQAVARAADRLVTLRDGKVLRDEPLESVYRQDLKEFKTSALGQAILAGTVPPEVGELGPLASQLRETLAKASNVKCQTSNVKHQASNVKLGTWNVELLAVVVEAFARFATQVPGQHHAP